MKSDDRHLEQILHSSGYPFQLGVQKSIEAFCDRSNWRLYSSEHPWTCTDLGLDGFVDLVTGFGRIRLVVECKRPRDGVWIFLTPGKTSSNVTVFRGCWAHCADDQPDLVGWSNWHFKPESKQSEFCLVRGQDDRGKSMLERLSSILVSATEAIGLEGLNILREQSFNDVLILFPVIVTCATLRTCEFEPDSVDLKNGLPDSCKFEEVPYIRFRKSLAFKQSVGLRANELGELARDRERSVFVVNASHLLTFLEEFAQITQFAENRPWLYTRQLIEQEKSDNDNR